MKHHHAALTCAVLALSSGGAAQATVASAATARKPIVLASAVEAREGERLLSEVGRLREEVGRLSLDAMIDSILKEESAAPAKVRRN